MNKDDFESQYIGKFLVSQDDNDLAQIAKIYHEEAEAYDRTVCSGPIIDGSIIPETSCQRTLISNNARKIQKRLENEYAGRFTRSQILSAIRNYNR